jgi:hypothetical protein
MVIVFVRVPDEVQEKARREAANARAADWWGIVLLPASLTGMQMVLAQGNEWGWTEPASVALALGSVFGLLAFIRRELSVAAPAVHIQLFAEPVFLFGTLMAALLYAMLIASQYLFPIFLQEILGFTATQAALALISRVIVSAVAIPLFGRFYNVLPPNAVLALGWERHRPSVERVARTVNLGAEADAARLFRLARRATPAPMAAEVFDRATPPMHHLPMPACSRSNPSTDTTNDSGVPEDSSGGSTEPDSRRWP